VEPEPLEHPEPKLQKIKPVVDVKPEVKEEPKKPEEAPKKPKLKTEATPKPKVRRKKKRKRKPVVAELAPLIVSHAGKYGTIGVMSGDTDQFGSGGFGARTPVEPADETDGADEGTGKAKAAPGRSVKVKILKEIAGTYPPEASGLGRYVRVEMSLLVGKKGHVRKVRIIRSGGKLFDREARRVGFALKFRPRMVDGVHKETWVPWTLEFLPPR
jgi:TonB family protein